MIRVSPGFVQEHRRNEESDDGISYLRFALSLKSSCHFAFPLSMREERGGVQRRERSGTALYCGDDTADR